MNNNFIVSFMKLYNLIIKCFKQDNDNYNIILYYNEITKIFNITIFNETKNKNAFYKDFVIEKKDAILLKNKIRDDFIKNQEIYLPYIQNDYKNKYHVIKNHKFILYVPFTESELEETLKIQEQTIKKLLIK